MGMMLTKEERAARQRKHQRVHQEAREKHGRRQGGMNILRFAGASTYVAFILSPLRTTTEGK